MTSSPMCSRGHKPHPDVPAGTTLFLVEPGKDVEGRERFSMVWYQASKEGRIEAIPDRPGGPSRIHVLCGHRGQCFRAVLDHHIREAEARGERVVVARNCPDEFWAEGETR